MVMELGPLMGSQWVGVLGPESGSVLASWLALDLGNVLVLL